MSDLFLPLLDGLKNICEQSQWMSQSIHFFLDSSLSFLINCFVPSHRLPMYIWGSIRFFLIIVNNLYCIPTHCLWLITLSPLKWFLPQVYLTLEGFGFQWLLSMVSAWSYTAGYNGISFLCLCVCVLSFI